jgi:hypothetical protein
MIVMRVNVEHLTTHDDSSAPFPSLLIFLMVVISSSIFTTLRYGGVGCLTFKLSADA